MIIDSHQHFWQISRGDYGWMTDEVAAIRRDILPADLHSLAQAAGVTGTVLVQAAPTLAETLFLLDLAKRTPLVRAVVGWIDLTTDVEAQLSSIAHPALRGIRPMLQDIDDVTWILQDAVIDGLRKVAAAGLRMDALITPRHLPVIDELARRLPLLPIVVDHCAKPAFAGADPGEDWRRGMTALAAHPQVFCKLSGLVSEFGPGWSTSHLQPVFDHVLAVFGAERLMWGSDWPVLEIVGAYPEWLRTAQDLTAALTAADRDRIFGLSAARFYGLT
ncbi:amidohydrolase [Paracoccus nototheniae]|uniref:Amidohydrolase family protein n=1 Tax=Paracoccus nototheniae TaxID=2489002 RepID=A0ABW4DW29_9RHOB|nr:amidohydrolase family protein [Paracoccus nototheniae]